MQLEDFSNAIPTLGYFNNRTSTSTWVIEPSKIDFIDLTYVTKGEATYTINNEKITVKTGDLLCIPKGSERYAISDTPAEFECLAANFTIHDLTSGKDIDVPLPLVSAAGVHGDIISYYRRLNEIWLSRPSGYIMCVRAYLMLILQRFLTILMYEINTHQFDPRVKKAIRFITDNYADSLNISTVAEAVSLNPVYFGALFKKETQVTFRDYLNTIRLNQAEDMLRSGKWNVSEVAQYCGFTDVFYFSRLFKKYKGVPPSTVSSKNSGIF